LRELATLFLAQKEFSGAHGLEVSDAMAVAIAAQACLPVLQLGLDAYSGFVGIVVHAGAVAAPRESIDEAGVVHEYTQAISGEAMSGGPMMLAWHDVADAGRSAEWGYNVVIHEFVHVLDMHAARHGMPALGELGGAAWPRALEREYRAFCARVDAGEDTFLDPYGEQAIEEFLAVASEAFFVAPQALRDEHPRLYQLLCRFFQQDPAAWNDAPND
jgi:Mlc titration factor MtfA (ptsG expression regulator)